MVEVSKCVGVRVVGGEVSQCVGVRVVGGGGVTVCGCDCDGICKVRRSDWTCTKMYTHCGLAPLAFPPGAGRYVHLPFLATLRSIKIAIFGNFLASICSHKLPFLVSTVIRQIVAIFGNFEVNKNCNFGNYCNKANSCHFWQL